MGGCSFRPSIYSVVSIALYSLSSMLLNFPIFHTSSGISSRPAAFLPFSFFKTSLSSSVVKSPILMSSCLSTIFWVLFSMILGAFPRSFWGWSFHFWSLSFWLVAFSFDLEVLFLSLILFTVCHANRDCLSSTDYLILFICTWMYSIWSFLYVLVRSIWPFLRLCRLVLVGFVLLHWSAFFI